MTEKQFTPVIRAGDTISLVHPGFVAICRVEVVRPNSNAAAGQPSNIQATPAEPSTIGQEATITAVIERAIER